MNKYKWLSIFLAIVLLCSVVSNVLLSAVVINHTIRIAELETQTIGAELEQVEERIIQEEEQRPTQAPENIERSEAFWESQTTNWIVNSVASTTSTESLISQDDNCDSNTKTETLKVRYENGLETNLNINACGFGWLTGEILRSQAIDTNSGEIFQVKTEKQLSGDILIYATHTDGASNNILITIRNFNKNSQESIKLAEQTLDEFIKSLEKQN